MDYLLVAIFAAVFAIALFWVVAKTLGKMAAVKASPTVDDVAKFLLPAVARAKARNEEVQVQAEDQHAFIAENLSESVRREADTGNKLEAVKLLMNETGGSLMEAKRTIEAYLSKK
jgi:ribosomal protein L7/L12